MALRDAGDAMGLDQTVTRNRLVAGIGFRHGTPSGAIVALIRRAMAGIGGGDVLVAIATAADRADELAIRAAADAFGLVPLAVEADALEQVNPRVPTRSARIERLRGVGSLAEAAALAIAGETGHLVLARIDDGRATCALAAMGREATIPNRLVRPPPSPAAGEGRGAAFDRDVDHVDPAARAGDETRIASADRRPNPASEPKRATTAQIATPTS